jgi:hypothetical protein
MSFLHGPGVTGVPAFAVRWLQRMLSQSGFPPADRVSFDAPLVVPPFDRLRRTGLKPQRTAAERTVARGWRRWMGAAHIVAVRHSDALNLA